MKQDYYRRNGMEVINVIDAFELDFYLGNVIKYVLRFNRKSTGREAVRDLGKAKEYLQLVIDKELKKLDEGGTKQ